MAELAGADSITVHLREDRRHIQDHDLPRLQARMQTHMNLEMAVTDEMVGIAVDLRPSDCCLVPEKREELTTEGGLDVRSQLDRVTAACNALAAADIRVSLFIDPDADQLDAAVSAGAPVVELHTGAYAEASGVEQERQLARIREACRYGQSIGLTVHAGPGCCCPWSVRRRPSSPRSFATDVPRPSQPPCASRMPSCCSLMP